MRRGTLPLLLLFAGIATVQDKATLTITIKAGKHERRDVPIVVPLSVPKALGELSHATLSSARTKKPSRADSSRRQD